jgi:uncharacterized protein
MLRKIEPSAFRRMPWNNGGGETAEIAIGPPGSSVTDFDWRISTARVSAPGPFSVFPGIDRSLIVLSGTGLEMIVTESDAIRCVVLDTESEPFHFAGDTPVAASLVEKRPIVDFNVMTRRDRYAHTVQKLCIAERRSFTANRIALYGLHGATLCWAEEPHAQALTLLPEQVVLLEPPNDQSAEILTVSVEPSGQTPCRLIAVMFNHGSHADG